MPRPPILRPGHPLEPETPQPASWGSTIKRGAPGCAVTVQQEALGVWYAQHPRRPAPLARQMAIALVTVALDGMACYLAAHALGESQGATMAWTGLFLAVLAGGQVALDFYRERGERAWRALAIFVRLVVTLLGTGGKGLVSASRSRPMTAVSSASRPATPRSSPAAIAAIVTALAAVTRLTTLRDTAAALGPDASSGRAVSWTQSRFAN